MAPFNLLKKLKKSRKTTNSGDLKVILMQFT